MPRPDQHPDCEIRPPENPPADFVPGPNVTLLHFETANRSRFWRWDARAHLERDERFLHTDDDIDRCQQVEVDLCIRNPADQLVWAGWAFDDSCDGVVVQGDSQLTHFDYDPDGRIVRWIGMARDIFVPASGDSASIYEVWFDDDGRVAVYAAWSCFEVGIGFELPTPSSGNCAQMEVGRFLYRPDGSVRAEESGFNGVLSQRTLYGEPCPEPIAGPDAGLADAAVGAGDLGARR